MVTVAPPPLARMDELSSADRMTLPLVVVTEAPPVIEEFTVLLIVLLDQAPAPSRVASKVPLLPTPIPPATVMASIESLFKACECGAEIHVSPGGHRGIIDVRLEGIGDRVRRGRHAHGGRHAPGGGAAEAEHARARTAWIVTFSVAVRSTSLPSGLLPPGCPLVTMLGVCSRWWTRSRSGLR